MDAVIKLTPALAAPEEDAIKCELPCGLAVKFVNFDGVALRRAEFDRLGISLSQLAIAAGLYSITYLEWRRVDAGVFLNDDGCWPTLAVAPGPFIEHNDVPGRPVLYVVDESTSILTGSSSERGLARIRSAMARGLGTCAMVLAEDRASWSPFDVRLLIGIRGAHANSSSTYVHLGRVRDRWRIPMAETLEFRCGAEPPTREAGSLSASIERQGRGAGVLGARFTPDGNSSAIVVSVSVGGGEHTSASIGDLSMEYARAVLEGIKGISGGVAFRELGAGRLDVLWARTHDIDSSEPGFHQLAERLVPLLALPEDGTQADVLHAWRRQFESVRLQRSLDWLPALLAKHANCGVFGDPAPEAQLALLEEDIGVALPTLLKASLRRFDGGSFIALHREDTQSSGEEKQEDVGRSMCELLSVEEIRNELGDLIATNEASVIVDGWQGRRPLKAMLIGEDGSPGTWPYLPIARTTEGHELLVISALEGEGGPVLDAYHELSPRHWGLVYERYVDFFEDFVANGGLVKVVGRRS